MWFKHRDKLLAINLDLVREQRVTFESFCEIIQLRKERDDLFELMRRCEDPAFVKIIFNQLTEVEYELQMAWGFEPNAAYHKSWTWPKCECPYSDNRLMPPGKMWVSQHCPLHGQEIKKSKS